MIKEQVDSYLRYCDKVRGMTDATMRMKRNILYRFIEVTKISGIEGLTNVVFDRWVEHEIGRGVGARSVNMYNAAVIALVRYCREAGMNVPLNLTLIRKIKEGGVRRRYYTAEEIAEVVKVAGTRTGLIIQIMFETGMRIAEVTRLRKIDINGKRIVFVGKGRKKREVYVTDETLDKIKHYVRENGVKGYMWGCCEYGNGEPPTPSTVRNWLKKAFCEAGYMDFYPHAIRHSFATDLQIKGATVEEIKEMMGHTSVAVTERYLHGFDGRLAELFEKYR